MANARYVFLDGIRGVAALLVLTRHTDAFWNFEIYRGYLAVDLFFVLSGFVIASAYDRRLRDGQLTKSGFMLVRLIRLYPMYLLSLVLAMLAWSLSATPTPMLAGSLWVASAMTAFFLPTPPHRDSILFPLNGPYWSLFFELIANLGYAVCHRVLSNRVLVWILSFAALVLARMAVRMGGLDDGYSFTAESLLIGLTRAVFGIAMGVLLFRNGARVSNWVERLGSPWLAFLVVCGVMLSPDMGRLNVVVDLAAVCLLFPLAVLSMSRDSATRFDRGLLALGAASYPMYVLHAPVGELVQHLAPTMITTFAPYSGVVFVALFVPLAVWLERRIDVPLRRSLTGRLIGRTPLQRA
ncbi:acyltransferase family protein [Niveibacterium sp.]|uniref:acyltransferase family protein n=1 Tax=Niveibacterium sp. TaxID=2017444 RepID=UPI0035B3C97B